nr:hypothetical protein HmN_000764700 [Hymenolepis microstoma]
MDGFDTIMVHVGVGYIMQKAGIATKQIWVVEHLGGGLYQMKHGVRFRARDVSFHLDEEFQETTSESFSTLTMFTNMSAESLSIVLHF